MLWNSYLASLRAWLSRFSRPRSACSPRRSLLRLECLEAREVPAVYSLTGGNLYLNPGSGQQLIDTNVRCFTAVSNQVFDLQYNGNVNVMNSNGSGKTISAGGTDLELRRSCEIGRYARDLASLLEQLGLESPTVFGVSFGGAIALELAAEYPGQVGALIVHGAEAQFRPTIGSTIARRVREAFFIAFGLECLWLLSPFILRNIWIPIWPAFNNATHWLSAWLGASSPLDARA